MSDLVHPRKQAGRTQFYPFNVTFKTTEAGNYVDVPGLVNLPCAYEAAQGGQPEKFQREAPTTDRLLLPQLNDQLRGGLIAVVMRAGQADRWFKVADVVPTAYGLQSLVTLTPEF